jgi:hypothetical protein
MKSSEVGAVLALWNDIDPVRMDEYERWHAIEHVPERVWVPGFVAATRYVADAGDQPRYFTLYELQSLECLETAAYLELVAEPTPWSASMRPAFTSFHRAACPLVVDIGTGSGAGLIAFRVVWTSAQAPATAALQAVASALFEHGDVTRVQIGEVTPAGSQALANERNAPPGREYLFLIQTLRYDEVVALSEQFQNTAAASLGQSVWHERTYYQFASHVQHSDVSAAQRPKPRLDLM